MSYTKQTWNTGDTITADKLNHMEDGIGGCGSFVVTATGETTKTVDKTNEEIYQAFTSGMRVTLYDNALREIAELTAIDTDYCSFSSVYGAVDYDADSGAAIGMTLTCHNYSIFNNEVEFISGQTDLTQL